MTKSFGLYFIFFLLFLVFSQVTFLSPFIIIGLVFLYAFRKQVKSPQKNQPMEDYKQADGKSVQVSEEKFTSIQPKEKITAYDPALVKNSHFKEISQVTSLTLRLMPAPKKLQSEDATLFLHEGEQCIFKLPKSSLATVAVYDRSMHLIGYIPKIKNSLIVNLIDNQRLIKGEVIKLNKSTWNKYIEIEITYQTN